MMRRTAIVLLICCCMVACNDPINEVEYISLSTNVLQLTVNDIAILQATASSEVKWHSADTMVATVMKGVVTAKSVGKTLITAQAGGKEAVCQVYVVGKDGSTLSLRHAFLQVDKGSETQMEVSSVYDIPLTWTSDNDSIATVTPDGVLHAHNAGHCTITVSNSVEKHSCYVAVRHLWGEYKLVWSDEFNGTTLDRTSWNVEVNGNGGGNNEQQYYTDREANLRVSDGNLIIEARKENYNGRRYTSARINTQGKRTFRYGKVEARIMFPSGGGTWPAFWMMGNDYPRVGWPACGEIDIVEHTGNNPRSVSHALHYPYKNGGNCWSTQKTYNTVENEYHIYGIEWLEEEEYGRDMIRFTVDGEVNAVVSETLENMDNDYFWPFNKDNFILLNMAIGGNMGGRVDDNIFTQPIIMKVDWVRVYQRKDK